MMRGDPYVMRVATGLRRPDAADPRQRHGGRGGGGRQGRDPIPPGDEVYAEVDARGFADSISVPENRLAHKPTNLTFEQAAAVPMAAMTALQALRDAVNSRRGRRS